MYKIIKQYFLSLIVCLIAVQSVMAIEIKTTVDRSQISINESLQITFSATETPDGAPSFSALEKDFEILQQSQSTHSSVINGQLNKTIEWVINVMAKHTGSLVIPPIAFGRDYSQPTTLLVKKNSSTNNKQQGDLFLKSEVTPTTAYVQSQIIYTLRTYLRGQIAEYKVSEPELENAIVEKLGKDKSYTTTYNGIGYAVIERKYAIFPQTSGSVTIKPIVLTAQVISDNQPRRYGFFNRQRTKTKRVMSNPVTLEIKAAPQNFTGSHWIPAAKVEIADKWSGDTQQMKVGEPLTRTLRLFAKGSTVAQLPELYKQTNNARLKTYPDQPMLREQKNDEDIVALREEKVAFIPSKAGTYTLEAIEVPWFNTETQQMEMARIPELTVTALGSAISEPTTDNDTSTTEAVQNTEVRVEENKFWMWLSIVFAVAWMITLYLLIKQYYPKQQEKPDNHKEVKLKQIVKELKKSCTENNADLAKDALLAWGRIKFNCINLSQIASFSEARLRDEILLLNQSLYANQSEQWIGGKLYQAFAENSVREKVAAVSNDNLELLNKI